MDCSKIHKAGIVVADTQEFLPVKQSFHAVPPSRFLPFEAAEKTLEQNGKALHITAVRSGVGKVNAASAAAFLIAFGADLILGYGLSGAVHNLRKGETAFGESYVEYDFDLSPLGYEAGVKPDQDAWLYHADPDLMKLALALYPDVKKCHVATGDRFVADSAFQKTLIGGYDAVCCEMESAAVASVCHRSGVPFLAVRSMTDDAGDYAAEAYAAENARAEDTAFQMVMNILTEALRRGA